MNTPADVTPVDVLIIGAGPTGLTAAGEAARHGLSVRIVDARETRSIHSKALVAHSRTLEVFTDMGFVESVLNSGQEFRALNVYAGGKAITRIDFRAIDWQDAIYPFWLSIPQSETERCLEEHLNQLGVDVERRTTLSTLAQTEEGVQATLIHEDGSTEIAHASWLVGCDGARSATRKLCDIAYEGTTADELFVLADVKIDWAMAEDEGWNFMHADGILLVVPMPEPARYRIIAHMPGTPVDDKPEITLDLLHELMQQRTGIPARLHDIVWTSNFTIKHLVAGQHRAGRIFLAGDAAHIHSPVGGQGLNTGIQDAYNLMWKLALAHKGTGTPALLDSYSHERHEVAENTIKNVSRATSVVTLQNPISQSVRNQLGSILINTDMMQNQMGRSVGMLDISYASSPAVAENRPERGPFQRVRESVGSGSAFSKGPGPGERAPNVLFLDENGKPHSLVDELYGTEHVMLLFAAMGQRSPSALLRQIPDMLAQRYAAPVRSLLVATTTPDPILWSGPAVVNMDGAVHRRFGAKEEALYLIRPDHHVGYRSQPIDPARLIDYLDGVWVKKAE